MLEFAPPSRRIQYDEAWLYCATCTHDNKHDWRFPTEQEIKDRLPIDPWYSDIFVDLEFLIFINAKYQTIPVRTKDA